jgi:uracil-DNA glycosylase
MDPLTILAALGPLAVDLGKSLIGRFIQTDSYKPVNIDEYAKMRQLDLEAFKAMNDAGGANPSYPWVEALVRLMRPAVALVVLGTWAALKLQGQSSETVDNFAAAVGFYLFGDRTLFYSNKNSSK